jgi:hypothetical protein
MIIDDYPGFFGEWRSFDFGVENGFSISSYDTLFNDHSAKQRINKWTHSNGDTVYFCLKNSDAVRYADPDTIEDRIKDSIVYSYANDRLIGFQSYYSVGRKLYNSQFSYDDIGRVDSIYAKHSFEWYSDYNEVIIKYNYSLLEDSLIITGYGSHRTNFYGFDNLNSMDSFRIQLNEDQQVTLAEECYDTLTENGNYDGNYVCDTSIFEYNEYGDLLIYKRSNNSKIKSSHNWSLNSTEFNLSAGKQKHRPIVEYTYTEEGFLESISSFHPNVDGDAVAFFDSSYFCYANDSLKYQKQYYIKEYIDNETIDDTIRTYIWFTIYDSSFIPKLIATQITEIGNNDFNIFPNPFISQVSINPGHSFESFKVYDISGKIIQHGVLSSNDIDLSNLENGVYLLMLSNSNSQTVFKKIIKE